MRAKKSLGQNFLMHAKTAERIADAVSISPEDTVVEIGPGTGMLTKPLLARAKKVIAIEADVELAQQLHETFSEEIAAGKLELITHDIRTFDLSTLPAGYRVVANIPYYITGEIIRSFLEATPQPQSMTLLVQKEVAERVARSKKESLLSLSVKVFGTPKYAFTVSRGSFVPAPNVDSAVLTIKNISRDNFTNAAEEATFFSFIHAGFAHKRKLLVRNLEAVFPLEKARAALISANISEKARAEDLSLTQWLTLIKNTAH